MDSEIYYGVKQLVLPNNKNYAGNLLWQCNIVVDEFSRVLKAIKLFEDEPVVVIYRYADNGLPKDTLKGCRFVRGYLKSDFGSKDIKDHELWLGKNMVHLGDVVDVVFENHLQKDFPKDIALKLFSFNVADDKNDVYNILHVNPILAYLEAKYNDNAPLKLTGIENLHPGMQFNRGKGVGKIEDLY